MSTVAHARKPQPVALSVALRQGTKAVHDAAETAPYVQQLLAGALPLTAFTALVAQNYAIYTALESAAERWRDDPVAGPFVFDELTRVPHLQADLKQLLGDEWADTAAQLRLPATDRYVGRIHDAATAWPGAFIAHHYVRYLGDLSGGQIIKAKVTRIYGKDGHRSTGFYTFDRIQRIKPFRDRYRQLLDQVPLSPKQQREVVVEAVTAFELNRAVFAELAERHLPEEGFAVARPDGS
jgi:heme oxygenase